MGYRTGAGKTTQYQVQPSFFFSSFELSKIDQFFVSAESRLWFFRRVSHHALSFTRYESLHRHVDCVLFARLAVRCRVRRRRFKSNAEQRDRKVLQLQIEFLKSFALGSRGLVVKDECHLGGDVGTLSRFVSALGHLVEKLSLTETGAVCLRAIQCRATCRPPRLAHVRIVSIFRSDISMHWRVANRASRSAVGQRAS